ncbi:MAG: MucB/RseB C-terminal domain-containing protein [Janthinobacterium lividum]
MPILVRRAALLFSAACLAQAAIGQTPGSAMSVGSDAASVVAAPAIGTVEWLKRTREASRQRTYVGTFVVSAATGNLSSARIWHVADGKVLMERIEALTGAPRTTFRRNDRVMTFLPEEKVVKSELRENLELFPNLPATSDTAIADFYEARPLGRGRVAGFDADVIQLTPRDGFRFGYRIWSERRTGLVIALQTVDATGRVVEQSAFSELQFDVPLKAQTLSQMMGNTAGYRIDKSELERTTADAEGWTLRDGVVGFKPVSCYRRALGGMANPERTMQWTFSDGMASVSLFVEPYDAQRQLKEVLLVTGATNTLTRRFADGGGDWWLTAVGEVPPETLRAFAQGLVRTR